MILLEEVLVLLEEVLVLYEQARFPLEVLRLVLSLAENLQKIKLFSVLLVFTFCSRDIILTPRNSSNIPSSSAWTKSSKSWTEQQDDCMIVGTHPSVGLVEYLRGLSDLLARPHLGFLLHEVQLSPVQLVWV